MFPAQWALPDYKGRKVIPARQAHLAHKDRLGLREIQALLQLAQPAQREIPVLVVNKVLLDQLALPEIRVIPVPLLPSQDLPEIPAHKGQRALPAIQVILVLHLLSQAQLDQLGIQGIRALHLPFQAQLAIQGHKGLPGQPVIPERQ